MGDLQTDQGESLELRFVPVSEFQRLLAAPASRGARVRAFAALARINTLGMIAGAWSGHIGTSFSSLEIAWTRVVFERRTIAGEVVVPFVTEGHEGFDINDPYDWMVAERLIADGAAVLPPVPRPSYFEALSPKP